MVAITRLLITIDVHMRRRSEGHETQGRKSKTNTEMTMLSNRIGDYWYISQGKTRIPGVNDGEAMEETDVSPTPRVSSSLGKIHTPSLVVRSLLAFDNVDLS